MCSKLVSHSRHNNQDNWHNPDDQLTIYRTFTLTMNRIFTQAIHTKVKRNLKVARDVMRIFSKHLALNLCFISSKNWVQREKCLFKTCLP